MKEIISKIWNYIMKALREFYQSVNCLVIKARLSQINTEIDFMKKYIENSEKGGATFAVNYFKQRLPAVTAERETLEAQLENSGCKEM
jgi:hypothetical protein